MMTRTSSRPFTGKLICFEGGDGAGKTTLASLVVEELVKFDPAVVLVEKGGTEDYTEPFLRERMRSLRKILWDYPREAPLGEWGDQHWFHLIVSWFSELDECLIRPLLREGKVVVVDGWYYKIAARFMLKPAFRSRVIWDSFRHLAVPDLVIFVDVDPAVAVGRRHEFSAAESGRLDGHGSGGADGFVFYQNSVLRKLRWFSAKFGWARIEASCLSVGAASALASARIRELTIAGIDDEDLSGPGSGLQMTEGGQRTKNE